MDNQESVIVRRTIQIKGLDVAVPFSLFEVIMADIQTILAKDPLYERVRTVATRLECITKQRPVIKTWLRHIEFLSK